MKSLRKKLKIWLGNIRPGRAGAFRYFGTQVYFPKNSLIFKRACEEGVYEHENLKIMLKLARPDSTVLDVGANIGLIAIPILRSIPRCTVVSFEPSPNSAPYLARTAAGSGFGERWLIVQRAAGCDVVPRPFYVAAPRDGAYDGLGDTGRAAGMRQIEVEGTTIDQEWQRQGGPRVSLIKIDTEGSELEVLRGAAACILRERPHLFVEWNAENLRPAGCPPERLVAWAEEFGYRLYSVPHLAPVTDREALAFYMTLTENFLLVPLP